MTKAAPHASLARVWFIFFASGAAGLGYEIVWTRWLSLGLGHEMPSMLAVVAAFFGGISIGAWSLDAKIRQSEKPSYSTMRPLQNGLRGSRELGIFIYVASSHDSSRNLLESRWIYC